MAARSNEREFPEGWSLPELGGGRGGISCSEGCSFLTHLTHRCCHHFVNSFPMDFCRFHAGFSKSHKSIQDQQLLTNAIARLRRFDTMQPLHQAPIRRNLARHPHLNARFRSAACGVRIPQPFINASISEASMGMWAMRSTTPSSVMSTSFSRRTPSCSSRM